MNLSTCGIDCDLCPVREEKNCPGCRAHQGKPFWGNCELYACAAEKQLLHCGFCADFPCKKLTAAHEEHSCDGIDVLQKIMEDHGKVQSRCGLMCNSCGWKDSHGCGGCIESGGHPFHGACPVAQCCQGKGFAHCGQCPDMPCEQLFSYSCADPEHGDKPCGARLSVLKYWAK